MWCIVKSNYSLKGLPDEKTALFQHENNSILHEHIEFDRVAGKPPYGHSGYDAERKNRTGGIPPPSWPVHERRERKFVWLYIDYIMEISQYTGWNYEFVFFE